LVGLSWPRNSRLRSRKAASSASTSDNSALAPEIVLPQTASAASAAFWQSLSISGSALRHDAQGSARSISISTGLALPAMVLPGAALHAAVIGGDDARDQRMAHHVGLGEADHGDALDAFERLDRVGEARARALGQVDL